MDDQHIEQRDLAARLQDSAITARIVRNIADIEQDYHFAAGPLSDKLMREVTQTIVTKSSQPWIVDDSGTSTLLTYPEWKSAGVGPGDAWLELGEISDDELDHSWISAAIRAGETQLCIELVFRRGLVEVAEGVVRNDRAVAPLLKLGMVRYETEPRLFIPIHIPAEALAMGLEQNDLDDALLPVRKAVEIAGAAKAELDKLIDKVRAEAKRK